MSRKSSLPACLILLAIFLRCSPASADECSPGDIKDCVVPNGSGYQHCPSGSWTGCVVAMCDFGYYIAGTASRCVSIENFSFEELFESGQENYTPPSTTTVTVISTVVDTSVATGPPPQTTPPAAEGVSQRDAYCQAASLQFINAANQLKRGAAAQAVTSHTQGKQLVARAQKVGGACSAAPLETYLLSEDEATRAATQLERETGMKPRAVAEHAREQSEVKDDEAVLPGLRALAAKMSAKEKKAALAVLDKLGEKRAKEIAATASALPEAVPEAHQPEETAGAPTAEPVLAIQPASATATSKAVAVSGRPTTPERMSDAALDELERMLHSASGENARRVLDEARLREFTLFHRVRKKYKRYHGLFTGPVMRL